MKKLQSKVKTEQDLKDMMSTVFREYYRKALSNNIKRALAYNKRMSTSVKLDV